MDNYLVIFVHTCNVYEKEKAHLIQKTWANNNNNIYFITDNENSILKNNIYIGEY